MSCLEWCRGWGNLGEGFDLPDTVLPLDNVPHDWLMPQCCAVVHHGGAGTTAAGQLLLCCFPGDMSHLQSRPLGRPAKLADGTKAGQHSQ